MTNGPSPLTQDERLLHLLGAPASEAASLLHDDLYVRVAHLCQDSTGSDLDLAVLIRHLLRRWSLRDGRAVTFAVAPTISARLRGAARVVNLRESPTDNWAAPAWAPSWLDAQGVPDAAAAAGTAAGRRFRADELFADPFFSSSTGHARYLTPGQRAACRAVISVPAGSTVIAMLPTGTGKTEVALCLAEQRKYAVTLVVVPTVALAYDFERRFRDHFARRNSLADRMALHFAWTASTVEEVRERLRSRVRDGRQPLLITSPESVSRALRQVLTDAAGTGRLGGIVVDEAHLVTQWGRDFRPEFRTLADLRIDLIRRAESAGHPKPTTLLLSATLGPYELQDLYALFARPGPCTLVAANALRAEPDLWVAEACDEQQREEWVLDALAHLPRPAILYVTSPKNAAGWKLRLQQAGYGRLALVTSETSSNERLRVLSGLRVTEETSSTIDLVVATSAFGLGIDYAHIRSVVHACLPETVDRWYQELGRGGRDGHISTAFLLTSRQDREEAASLATTVLTAETGRKRWLDLWSHRKVMRGRSFVDLERSRGSVSEGSYNRRWNAQLVQGLVELEAVRRLQIDIEDISELADDTGRQHDWVAVEVVRGDLSGDKFWADHWTPWQQLESSRSRRALDAILALAKGSVGTCHAIAQAYQPNADTYRLFGQAAEYVDPTLPCGRCSSCRQTGITSPDDPPPRPMQVWPLADSMAAHLDDLAEAAGAQDRLILLVTDDHELVAHRLAHVLVRRGVRHLAGPMGETIQHKGWLFVDQSPVAPPDLTPCSSFVVYPATHRISGIWLSPKARFAQRVAAPLAFDVLLLSRHATAGGRRVGRDLPALDAITALYVLGG